MKEMYLKYFAEDCDFPFFIQFGTHDEKMILHSHADFTELVLVLEGTAIHIVGNEEFEISKGDVFVISDNTVHGYIEAKNFKICNIMFRMEESLPKLYDIWQLEGFHALFVIEPYLSKDYSFQSRLKLPVAQLGQIELQLNKMVEEYQNRPEGWKTFLQMSFLRIALELSRSYKLNSDTENAHLTHLLKPISYIEKHYMEEITLDELAKQANFSSRQLSRLFREVYHSSPGKYLLQFRIQKAKGLLNYPNLSIADIAFQCGFNDSNYFSRQFQKQTGCSPSQYRKLYK